MDAIDYLNKLDLNRFYNIYNTIHEMLGDRGYTPELTRLSKKEWCSQYMGYLAELAATEGKKDVFTLIDKLALLFTTAPSSTEPGTRRMLVYFHLLDNKLCQNDMNYVHKLMKENTVQQLIIVVNKKATPKVENVIGLWGNNAQLFFEDELVFNVTKHQLVPKHELVTDPKEREKILSFTILPNAIDPVESDEKTLNKITHENLIPGIFTTDPIVKYYNYKVDDLIRVRRPRRDGYTDLSYRIVTYPMTDKD